MRTLFVLFSVIPDDYKYTWKGTTYRMHPGTITTIHVPATDITPFLKIEYINVHVQQRV
jgi:hypothetical protein